jgi:hypothetical protein
MSNEKTEFDNKGIPSNLISDNGDSYQTKDVFRGDYKGPEERKAVSAKRDLIKNDASVYGAYKQ